MRRGSGYILVASSAVLALLSSVILVEVTQVTVPDTGPGNPWIEFAGMFKDDPYFDEWQEAIAENRRKADQDPDIQ